MLTQDDLKAIGLKVKEIVKPLKEDIEIVKSKVSSLELDSRITNLQTRKIKDQQSVINGKLDYLKGKADQTFDLVEVLEDNHEKRLKKVETKLNLPTVT